MLEGFFFVFLKSVTLVIFEFLAQQAAFSSGKDLEVTEKGKKANIEQILLVSRSRIVLGILKLYGLTRYLQELMGSRYWKPLIAHV